MEKIVLLLSGGMDSSVLLRILSKQHLQVLPVFIDYGQRNKQQEFKAAKYFSKLYNCKLHKIQAGHFFRDSLLINGDNAQSTFLPHRNLLFLVLGAIYAYYNGCNAVAIALHAGNDYPDSGQSFVEKASKSISESVGKKIIIHAPFINIHKSDVAYLAHLMNLPIEKTYSCYIGEKEHCKKCSACIQRFDSIRAVEKYVSNDV